MITKELTDYIKNSLAQGKSVDEIKNVLRQQGWTEQDLAEAFAVRTKGSGMLLKILILLLFVGLGVGGYFAYKSDAFQKTFLKNEIPVDTLQTENSIEKINNSTTPPEENTAKASIAENSTAVKDCGVSSIKKTLVMNDFYSFKNDPVLTCLGQSAISCENAKGTFYSGDYYIPNIFEIVSTGKSCDFKLSFDANSTIVSKWTNEKLAGKYIQCPISSVQVLDEEAGFKPENKDKIIFKTPNKSNPTEYAYQISAYDGILSLFRNESDFQKVGCSGDLVKYYIATNAAVSNKLSNQAIEERDQSLISVQAEAFKDNVDWANLCKDAGVVKAMNDIKSKYIAKTACFNSTNNFAVSASFPDGTMVCTDDSGFNDVIKKQITGPKCQ